MSIFSSIMEKIFPPARAAQPDAAAAKAGQSGLPTSAPPTAAPASGAGGAPAQTVDVEAVLTQMAAQKGGGGNWQTSIVDLLKLLDLDFKPERSQAARRRAGRGCRRSRHRRAEHRAPQGRHAEARRERRQGPRQPEKLIAMRRRHVITRRGARVARRCR